VAGSFLATNGRAVKRLNLSRNPGASPATVHSACLVRVNKASPALVVIISLILGIAKVSLGQELASVSVHRSCIEGGPGEKVQLRYWFPDEMNNGISEPVCVFKTPEFGGFQVRSVRIEPDRRSGIGAIVVVEFDEAARPLIAKMSQGNVGKLVAVVVGNRIISMPMIWRPFSDKKLLICVSSVEEAARIVAAIKSGPEDGKN
jgi:preprotein translocase subunit SecD